MRMALCGAVLMLPLSSVAHAQAIKNEPPMREFTEEEIAAVEMPELAFESSDKIVKDFEKYFYFHRADTSFAEAYADVTECDALTSGLRYYGGNGGASAASAAQMGVLPSAIGGAVASVLADAIFGSAERRKQRRVNLRNCMYFKGYDRYGLEKDLWQEFNFEEGFSKENASKREAALLKQAKVASGPKPEQEVLVP